jgi:hypothetical protein
LRARAGSAPHFLQGKPRRGIDPASAITPSAEPSHASWKFV